MIVKSTMKGVHYLKRDQKWIAQDMHRKVIYRGNSKTEAENVRAKYDRFKDTMPKVKKEHTSCKNPFPNVVPINWPVSKNFEGKI